MEFAILTLVQIVSWLLNALSLLMFLRAVLSWLPFDEDSRIYSFVYLLTEPIVYPFRIITDKIPALQGSPLDVAYLMALLSLWLIQLLLPAIRF